MSSAGLNTLRYAFFEAERRYRRTGKGKREALEARALYLAYRDQEHRITLGEMATRAALVPTEYRDPMVEDLDLGDVIHRAEPEPLNLFGGE